MYVCLEIKDRDVCLSRIKDKDVCLSRIKDKCMSV